MRVRVPITRGAVSCTTLKCVGVTYSKGKGEEWPDIQIEWRRRSWASHHLLLDIQRARRWRVLNYWPWRQRKKKREIREIWREAEITSSVCTTKRRLILRTLKTNFRAIDSLLCSLMWNEIQGFKMTRSFEVSNNGLVSPPFPIAGHCSEREAWLWCLFVPGLLTAHYSEHEARVVVVVGGTRLPSFLFPFQPGFQKIQKKFQWSFPPGDNSQDRLKQVEVELKCCLFQPRRFCFDEAAVSGGGKIALCFFSASRSNTKSHCPIPEKRENTFALAVQWCRKVSISAPKESGDMFATTAACRETN